MKDKVKIEGDYIKLDQLLKLINIADSGGHAKNLILNGEVKVNGEIINQRGKKIKVGDQVDVEGVKVEVI